MQRCSGKGNKPYVCVCVYIYVYIEKETLKHKQEIIFLPVQETVPVSCILL